MDSHSFKNAMDIAVLYRKTESILPPRNKSPNALHVAAALGLPSLVREIIDRSPELALSFDEHGLTPCHVAVVNGQISIIKELLNSKIGDDICRLRDKDGFLPIHTAVMKGSVDALDMVNHTCHMWMLRESTWQGDNILHLALKFDSLEAFYYLWNFLCGDKNLLDSRDEEGNTLLHLAVTRRQHEVAKLLVGKVDLNVVNKNDLTALDIFFDLGHEHRDMTIAEMIRRAGGRRAIEHEAPQSTRQLDGLQTGEIITQLSSPKAGTKILFHLRRRLFDFRRALSRRVPNDKDRETSNTLMVVATLIATITFQSALNPPGGFIQDGEDRGMAVLESYLKWYLFYNIMAFISSLSVILLTIYIIPKWKDLVTLAKFIVWVSVFFTFVAFRHAIAVVFGHIIHHPLILACIYIGDGIVNVFAFLMFVHSWYLFHKSMSTSLHRRSTKGIVCRSKIIVIACLAFLGAALVWLPIVIIDVIRYYKMLYG